MNAATDALPGVAHQTIDLVGATRIGQLNQLIESVLTAWSQTWGVAPGQAGLACLVASDDLAQAGLVWQHRYEAPGKGLWLAWDGNFVRHLQEQIFAGRPLGTATDSLGNEVATRALRDLSARLGELVRGSVGVLAQVGAPARAHFAPGSGALLATIRISGKSMSCLLESACVHALSPPPALAKQGPLAPVRLSHALRNVGVTLPLSIGTAEVDIGNFLTLVTGDVIRLEAPLAKPMAVSTVEGAFLFAGYLAAVDGSMAFEVTRTEHGTNTKI